MNSNINLLGTKRQSVASVSQKKISRVRFVAMSFLFLVSASAIVLFLLISLSPLPAVQKQADEASRTLSQSSQTIVQLLFVQDRIKTSQEIIKKRPKVVENIERITSKMPTGMQVTGYVLHRDVIELTLLSKSLPPLDTFVDELVNASDNKKDFKKVSIGGLSKKDNGFSLTITVEPL